MCFHSKYHLQVKKNPDKITQSWGNQKQETISSPRPALLYNSISLTNLKAPGPSFEECGLQGVVRSDSLLRSSCKDASQSLLCGAKLGSLDLDRGPFAIADDVTTVAIQMHSLIGHVDMMSLTTALLCW